MAKKKIKPKVKQTPKPSSIPENLTSKVLADTYSSPSPPVFMKVCRLCESKDGPFLNIFDADKVTAKKIEELMPFGIAENDDLPHKICFRCSAKLEELHEFIQKCIKTQESLQKAIGKTGPLITKAKTVKVWEEKLNKNNMSNDDICDALIMKAMAGIKNIPLSPPVEEKSPPPNKRVTRRTEPAGSKTEAVSDNEDSNISLKDVKSQMLKNNEKGPGNKQNKQAKTLSNNVEPAKPSSSKKSQREENQPANKPNTNPLINNFSFDYGVEKTSSEDVDKKQEKPAEKPFNIMDHISMIKVNGVGVLFQCKLCNRNFLKKEVVESHHCAKNGVPKVETPKVVPVPEAPKVSTVKYITLGNTAKQSQSWKCNDNSNGSSTDGEKSSGEENKQEEQRVQPAPKPKPKAGPASKTRRVENDNTHPGPSHSSDSQQLQTNVQTPSVHIPSAPNLNGRFKLVPGPNNMFTLVEDTSVPTIVENNKSKKRKSETESEVKSKEQKRDNHKSYDPDVTIPQDKSTPYPVGLFQTVAHSGQMYQQPMATPTAFTTPAMKKQSYTVVQTGNPSKLLISTKALDLPVEAPKKRVKRSKPDVPENEESKEPFKVTLEDVAPPKDAGFFTFINVDPLLQPSYVLPTDNIIQESQISTSSAVRNAAENVKESKDSKYSCNMCGENFTREKKLLAHIQSHYTKMDEEDQLRADKGSKKKSRK
ncbi:unnamed protein product [Spodoptera exigua]|nr:unnamed protein product [Spodoptera exigua]